MTEDVRKKLKSYDVIVGYGIGQNYERLKEMMKDQVSLDYLADQKWENEKTQKFDGIPVIRLCQLKKLKNVLVVLFPESHALQEVIRRELEGSGFDICNICDLITIEHCVNGRDLAELLPVCEYQDSFHNRILFDASISPNIKIYFWGENNFLKIGSNVSIKHLEIYFGNNGNCVIGDSTSIEKVEFHVSDALLDIGKDCMLSKEILIRTHDNHHIFDKDTKARINYARDVIIEDQVWIGYGASILSGAKIGTGSMVGEKAVTSSDFPDHVLIAGCPADILRKNICWSRDNTFFFSRDNLGECMDKNALSYMDTKTVKKIYIAGAHSRARTLAVYLQYLFPEVQVGAYLYDNGEENPVSIKDTPVLSLSGEVELNTDWPVCIGTRGVYHRKITEHLRCLGFKQIYPITAEIDTRIRNLFLAEYFNRVGRKFTKIDDLASPGKDEKAMVYVVKSVHDKPLEQEYTLASYEREIQAGAALSGKHLSGHLSEKMTTDDIGDNISSKNRQFCELTALYWIWKNVEADVIGLEHYRRRFLLPDNWLERMEMYGIDVILPVPLYVVPNIAENYKSRHDPSDWEYMMEYLKSCEEGLACDAKRFFQGNLYSPCNMFIMKKDVLNDLCGWLFPILDAVAVHGGQKEDPYLNRYPGFLSERLITYFFERYRDKYKLVYADKNFLR